MIRKMARNRQTQSKTLSVAFALAFGLTAWGQTQGPLGYSVATPRPISPAEGTTTPSAQATQRQNPYLGSVPSKNTGTRIELSLKKRHRAGPSLQPRADRSQPGERGCPRRTAARTLRIVAATVSATPARVTKTSATKRSA